MLRTHDLRFAYDPTHTFHFPDIHAARGEQWLLLGQSGSGKTTLLHLLAGLLRPQSGQVIINEQDITALRGSALDHFRGRHVGLVFQRPHFVRSLSVLENLLLAQSLAGLKPDRARALELLGRLGLAGKQRRAVDRLSVGEQQRVTIARALINRPAVILADEPTSALDDVSSGRVVQLLEEQAAAVNATLLIVTHDNRLKTHFGKRIELDRVQV